MGVASGAIVTILGMVVRLIFGEDKVKLYGYDKANEDHKFKKMY